MPPADFGGPSMGERLARTSALCLRSSASFTSCPYARSTPVCEAKATAPSRKFCLAFEGPRRIGKPTPQEPGPPIGRAWPENDEGGYRLLLHYPIKRPA